MNWSGLGKEPISGDAPAGIDVTYAPSFDQLNEEVKKLGSPTASPVDWTKVRELSVGILQDQSKNYLVACYLCVALQRLEGWRGFAGGIHVLTEMLNNYWENGYPPKARMRGRRNALTWWQEQTEAVMESTAPEEWAPVERQALLDNLWSIDRALGEYLEDAPTLSPLIKAIGDRITEPLAAQEKEIPGTAESIPSQTVVASLPVAPPPQRIEAAPDQDLTPEKNFQKGCEFLRLAATQSLGENPFHALSYRINRIAAWFPIDALPPATANNTLLPPPDPQQRAILKGLYQAQNWQGLLDAAEPLVSQYLFWLDLSCYVGEALERLGQKEAAQGVVAETLLFCKRLSGIEKLCFNEATPFADQLTRDWIEENIPGSADAGSPASTGQDEELQVRIMAAQTTGKENPTEALDLFQTGFMGATTARERLAWSIELCRFLCRQQQPVLALPYAELILQQVDSHQLEQWEPIVAENAFETVLSCLQQHKAEEHQAQSVAVFQRLALLNPGRAMKML